LFTLENIIGDIVFISLRDKSFLSKIAISEELNHFKVMGQDQLGLWVEHPQLTFKYNSDKDGNSIPENEQKTEKVDAVFLIAWGNIDTIMHYPNREGYDFPSEFDTNIGFK
tara:strand:+ start:1827 stop:2159 length:333 start_codon:yes stop_codon:yes gene_type:complete